MAVITFAKTDSGEVFVKKVGFLHNAFSKLQEKGHKVCAVVNDQALALINLIPLNSLHK